MLEGPVMTPVKIDQECQDLAQGQCRLARAVSLAHVQQVAVVYRRKSLAEIANIAEHSNQSVHSGSGAFFFPPPSRRYAI
jgi:hypothetical protein